MTSDSVVPSETILQAIIQLHQAGDLAQAERGYLSYLSQQPDALMALGMLGVLYLETGRFHQADELLGRALEGLPDNPVFLLNRANLLLYRGEIVEVADLLARLKPLAPDWLDVSLAEASWFIAQRKWADAEHVYATLMPVHGRSLHVVQGYATVLDQQGRLDQALDVLREAKAQVKEDIELDLQFGHLLLKARRLSELEQLREEMASYCPNDRRFILESARLYLARGQDESFLSEVNRVITAWPEDLGGNQCLVDYFRRKGRVAEAMQRLWSPAYKQNGQLKLAEYFATLLGMHAYRAARSVLERLEGLPKLQMAGFLALRTGNAESAVEFFEQYLKDVPGDYATRFALSMAQFHSRSPETAWQNYSARFLDWNEGKIDPTPLKGVPAWSGESCAGKRVFVFCEQGIGDAIQFIRFLPELVRQGGVPVLHIYEELLPLLVSAAEHDAARPAPAPERGNDFDFQIPLLSLPEMLGAARSYQADVIPYIHVSDSAREAWADELARFGQGVKVGLVWAGNPKHINDSNRSIELSQLSAWSNVPGVRWINLQYGGLAEQIELLNLDLPVERVRKDITSLYDTASLIAGLDLVITVDTSVAHLAGAMGKPVWILLPYTPDWRWGADGETTPWYPSARLYRQQKAASWASVIQRVRDDLLALTRQQAANLSAIQIWAQSPDRLPTETELASLMIADMPAIAPILLSSSVTLPQLAAAGVPIEVQHDLQGWLDLERGVLWPADTHQAVSRALLNKMWARAYRDLNREECLDWLARLDRIRHVPMSAFWRAQILVETEPAVAESLVRPLGMKAPRHLPFRLLAYLAMHRFGAKQSALHYAQTAVHCDPYSADAWAALLIYLLRVGLPECVRDLLLDAEEVLHGHPDYPYIRAHLAMQLALPDEADRWWRACLAVPQLPKEYGRQFEVLTRLGEYEKAMACYSEAETRHGMVATWAFGRALVALLTDGGAEAWAGYEWRPVDSAVPQDSPVRSLPRWQGESLDGKTLLVYAEQGFGDQIYFGKCLPELKAKHLLVALDGNLSSLFGLSVSCEALPAKALHANELSLGHVDFVVPIGSLPSIMGFAPKLPPPGGAYLAASNERYQHWVEFLKPFSNYKIGLSWAGNPDYARDEYRSLKLEQLSALAEVDNVTYFSLQLGVNQREILFAPPGLRVLDLSANLEDFAETAAIIQSLDLVVTVDTSMAHLAAALGKLVWVLIPHDCDWRWGLERADCPWYPTMRLFRQPSQGSWAPVIAELVAALNSLPSKI